MKAMHIALGLTLTAVVAMAADGEKYTSKEGQFAIALPKDSKVKTGTNKTENGVSLNTAMVENQGVLYGVVYADVPEADLKDTKAFFDSVERGLVRKSGAKVLESKEIEFGPGKLVGRNVLSEKDGTQGRLLLVVKGSRFYGVMLRGSKEFMGSKEAKAFFDSFELK